MILNGLFRQSHDPIDNLSHHGARLAEGNVRHGLFISIQEPLDASDRYVAGKWKRKRRLAFVNLATKAVSMNNLLLAEVHQGRSDAHHGFLVAVRVVRRQIKLPLRAAPIRVGKARIEPLHAHPVVPHWPDNLAHAPKTAVLVIPFPVWPPDHLKPRNRLLDGQPRRRSYATVQRAGIRGVAIGLCKVDGENQLHVQPICHVVHKSGSPVDS
mmetsp:Transcript_44291/g.92615  ORF Transcript_44291/g.92615 Transcript_44291/m.92615 type:complete len:212 (-) Transcript_44291:857-1492(-)